MRARTPKPGVRACFGGRLAQTRHKDANAPTHPPSKPPFKRASIETGVRSRTSLPLRLGNAIASELASATDRRHGGPVSIPAPDKRRACAEMVGVRRRAARGVPARLRD